jgi:hypothetical protein
MENMVLWGIVFALTTSLFSFSVSLSTVARTFEGYDIALVQEAVDVPFVESGVSITQPYFDKGRLEKLTSSYFARGLEGYVASSQWSLTYSYQDFLLVQTNMNGSVTKTCPQGVLVTFHCHYAGGYLYENHRLYTIQKGEHYGR